MTIGQCHPCKLVYSYQHITIAVCQLYTVSKMPLWMLIQSGELMIMIIIAKLVVENNPLFLMNCISINLYVCSVVSHANL